MFVQIGKSIRGAEPIPLTATPVMSLSYKALHSLHGRIRQRRLYGNTDSSAFAGWTPGARDAGLETAHHDNLAIVAGFWR
jgi:hypothetical protein